MSSLVHFATPFPGGHPRPEGQPEDGVSDVEYRRLVRLEILVEEVSEQDPSSEDGEPEPVDEGESDRGETADSFVPEVQQTDSGTEQAARGATVQEVEEEPRPEIRFGVAVTDVLRSELGGRRQRAEDRVSVQGHEHRGDQATEHASNRPTEDASSDAGGGIALGVGPPVDRVRLLIGHV